MTARPATPSLVTIQNIHNITRPYLPLECDLERERDLYQNKHTIKQEIKAKYEHVTDDIWITLI